MEKKDNLKNIDNNNWNKFKSTIWFIVIFGFLSIIIGLIIQALFYDSANNIGFWKSLLRFTIDKYNLLGSVLALMGIVISIISWMFERNKKIINKFIEKSEDIAKGIDEYLKKSKIVFESNIKEFNDKHLLALQRILNALDTNINEVYAIDNSDPITWWSDTMTGYLALLAKWKSMDSHENRRQVSRIFVVTKNELLSPVFAKTITLHSLMGFRTYIYSKELYDKVFDSLKNDDTLINKKEVFIWNTASKTDSTYKDLTANFNLNERDWRRVKCYQSFWNIDDDRNLRDGKTRNSCEKWDNFYEEKILTNQIDVWFEFIAHEKKPNTISGKTATKKKKHWEIIPKEHFLLIKKLIELTHCCKNPSEVKQLEISQPFGIEIKTNNCTECEKKCNNATEQLNGTKFDFTSADYIQKMLKEYYNKIIN